MKDLFISYLSAAFMTTKLFFHFTNSCLFNDKKEIVQKFGLKTCCVYESHFRLGFFSYIVIKKAMSTIIIFSTVFYVLYLFFFALNIFVLF